MKAGDIVLARVPQGSTVDTKARPALVLAELPGVTPTVLLCAISSRLDIRIDGWDVLIGAEHPDFTASGLHVPSMIRPSWLAAFPAGTLARLGSVNSETLRLVRQRLVGVLSD